MNDIRKNFYSSCAQIYKQHGFWRRGSSFVRINGDIVQAFSLRCFRGISVCTVEFGVFPMCLPQPVYFEAGGYELHQFVYDSLVGANGWHFDFASPENVTNCIESIFQVMNAYLIPFFDACNGCASTLTEVLKLEELLDSNRRKWLCQIGEKDYAPPWQERSLYDPRKYYMALKSHNWAYAKDFLKQWIVSYTKSANDSSQPESVRERCLKKILEYTEVLGRLESGNIHYFEELVDSNEQQMKNILSKGTRGRFA